MELSPCEFIAETDPAKIKRRGETTKEAKELSSPTNMTERPSVRQLSERAVR